IECKYENDDAQNENKICIRELKSPPGNFTTCGFKRDQQGRQTDKPCKNPPSKSDSAAQDFLTALPRVLNEAENLERDDRQNTGHQVQNDSAQKTEKEKREDSACGSGPGARSNRSVCNLPGGTVFPVGLLTENEQSFHRQYAFVRRLDWNVEGDFVSTARLNHWMTDRGIV